MDRYDVLDRIRLAMIEREDSHPSIDVNDRAVVKSILHEINLLNETNVAFKNIEELNQYHIRGAGPIVAKYIWDLKSQTARSGLLHHLIGNRSHRCARVKNCSELVWKLFLDFIASNDCFDCGILNDYDDAFAKLKPKEYEIKFVEISQNPYLFNNMSRTMCMLASWQNLDFRNVLLDYFSNPNRIEECLSRYSINKELHLDEDRINREIDWWEKSGKYTVIDGLKYYPSERIVTMLTQYASDIEEEMSIELQKHTDRYSRSDIRYRYSSILKTVRNSIKHIESEMLSKNS